MDINLINFLEELETKGLFKSKVGEIDEKFKKFVDSLKISIEEKQILETLFNEAVKNSKNEFLEIGFLYGKEKKIKKYGSYILRAFDIGYPPYECLQGL